GKKGENTMKKFRFSIYPLAAAVFIAGCSAPKITTTPASTPAVKSVSAEKKVLSPALEDPAVKKVGLDIDDTVLFSSPAFDKGYESAQAYTDEFWTIVNTSDEEVSLLKPKTIEIIKAHQKKGHEVFLITARNSSGGETLKKFMSKTLGIPENNIFFAPSGKTELIKKLGLDAFYGDSDSDIQYALDAGAMPIRIQRSPESGYKSKYNPGSLDEFIVPDSE
ncbi:MAG: HAD family acid phosphatase, partial [Elusimicrobiota bacterium]|nr:HAD family acid phosphatase [Elusimicrobiota bacterium]